MHLNTHRETKNSKKNCTSTWRDAVCFKAKQKKNKHKTKKKEKTN